MYLDKSQLSCCSCCILNYADILKDVLKNNFTTQNMCYLIMSTLKEGDHATHPDIRLSILSSASPKSDHSGSRITTNAFQIFLREPKTLCVQSPNGNDNNWPVTCNSLSHQREFQHSGSHPGACEYPRHLPALLTWDKSGKGQSPAPPQDLGSSTLECVEVNQTI